MDRRARLLASLDEDAALLFADGFDAAILGTVTIFTSTVVLYDRAKVLHVLQHRDGMDAEEAEEFFEFNIAGAYAGEQTPGFADLLDEDER